jgi:hypothetical protein
MKNKRGREWGTGWDGRSRIPDETYKNNYDQIDWSSVKKEKTDDGNNKKKNLSKNTSI